MDSVVIPLINPNEPEALLAALHVSEGQRVSAGDPLCTLETTKASAELAAERDGYVVGLRCQAGQTARAGEVLCYLADHPDDEPPQVAAPESPATAELPPGLRITSPALALARQHGLDLSRLPQGPLLTESALRAFIQAETQPDFSLAARPLASPFDPQAILVYGAGGHGKSLLDLLRSLGTYRIVGFVDDGLPQGQDIMGLPVLGGMGALPELHAQGVRLAANAVGGIGDVTVRVKVFHTLAQAGFACPALSHPSAVIEPSASLSPAVQVFAQAYVGSQARLGYCVIVNTAAIVSHDCTLGDYANISPGAMLAGGVQIGDGALIGMGVTVNLAVKVGAGARVGNGATVKADVPERGVVRAGAIWPE